MPSGALSPVFLSQEECVAVVDELTPPMRRNIPWYLMAFEASDSINPMRRDAAAQQLRGQAVQIDSGLDVSATGGTASAGSQCCSVLNRYRIETRPVLTNPHRGGDPPDGFLADLMNPVAVRQCFGNSF
jgi:hypothetical protein